MVDDVWRNSTALSLVLVWLPACVCDCRRSQLCGAGAECGICPFGSPGMRLRCPSNRADTVWLLSLLCVVELSQSATPTTLPLLPRA